METPAPTPATSTPAAPGAAAPAAVTEVAPGATNAPAAKAAKKKVAKKKAAKKATPRTAPKKGAAKSEAAAELKTVPLAPGPAVVIASRVNVRGQAKLKSEIVARLNNGEPVTVLEEVTLKNSAPDEPSAWAKILLPPNTPVWVSALYVDASTKTVKARKLNLRSGPGENYSVLGLLEQGDVVKDLSTKEDWIEIEAPTNAYAFVAAQYLKQEEPTPPEVASVPTTRPSETSPTPPTATAPVVETPAIAPAEPPPVVTPPVEPPVTTTSAPESLPAETKAEPTPRIVQREGKVRGMTSIQAPSHFELVSLANGKTIDYLYTTLTNLDLRRYKGLRIIVSGEEGLDARWGNTPVLNIQRIQVLPEPEADYDAPAASN